MSTKTPWKAANDILAMTVGRVHKLGLDKSATDPFVELLRELREAGDDDGDHCGDDE